MARSRILWCPALAAAACAACWLVGCGEHDEARVAIEKAGRSLSVLNAGEGTRSAGAGEVYEEVASAIRGVEGSEAQNAALALIDAQVKQGQAEPKALEAARLEALAQHRIAEAEAELRAWASHHARASAASAFDPGPVFAELDAREGDRRAQAEAERAASAALGEQIASIRAQAEGLRGQADEIRARAAEAQRQGQAGTATAGLSLVQEAYALSREADALELESERLSAEAARLEPTKTEHDVVAEKLEGQLAVLDEARRATTARQAELAREAAEARGLADVAAERLRAVLGASGEVPEAQGLIPLRSGPLRSATEAAAEGFESAAGAAQRARAHNRGAASMAIGAAQQALGGLRMTQAEGLGAFAQLMERAAAIEPALPDRASYAQGAREARQAEAAAVQQAAEALQASQDAFGGAGARGEAAEQLDRVNAQLARLSLLAQDKDPGAATYAANPEGEAGGGAGGGAGFEGSDDAATAELRAAIDVVIDATLAGDGEALGAFIVPAGALEQRIVDALVPHISASGRLDAATEAAFGEKFSAWGVANQEALGGSGGLGALGGLGGMGGGAALDPAQLANLSADQLDIRARGDEGVVVLGGEYPNLSFVRGGDGWKLSFDLAALGMPPEAASGLEPILGLVSGFEGVYDELVGEVQSGALQSNQAVAVALMQKSQPLMQQMMGAMMGGSGGPGGN